MSNAEADHNEEVFLRDCLILKAQLEQDDLPRAQPCRSFLRPGDATLMPQYPRDTTSISDEVRNHK